MRSAIVSAPAPFNSIVLQCKDHEFDSIQGIYDALLQRLPSTLLAACTLSTSSPARKEDAFSTYHLLPRTLGGKGGFGHQLRASGNRKKANKDLTRDAGKDASGRRLRTLKQAETLALALQDLPAREKAARAAKREELERLLKSERPVERFDDEEYLDDCQTVINDIKSAMQDALDEDDDESENSGSGESSKKEVSKPRKLQGWDDDDDDDDDGDSVTSEEESAEPEKEEVAVIGKGKGIARPIPRKANKRRKAA